MYRMFKIGFFTQNHERSFLYRKKTVLELKIL